MSLYEEKRGRHHGKNQNHPHRHERGVVSRGGTFSAFIFYAEDSLRFSAVGKDSLDGVLSVFESIEIGGLESNNDAALFKTVICFGNRLAIDIRACLESA